MPRIAIDSTRSALTIERLSKRSWMSQDQAALHKSRP
jgi:hypothetical protein